MTGDNTDKTENDPAPDDIPEVDAEVVNDDADDAPEPFDEPAPSTEAPAPKRSIVSAGVLLFAGLVLVASAAGAVWFFTKGEEKRPAASETSASPPASIPETEPGAAEAPGAKLTNGLASTAKPDTQPAAPGDEKFTDKVAALPTPAETIANTLLQDADKDAIRNAAATQEPQPESDDSGQPAATLEASEMTPLDAQDAAPVEPSSTQTFENNAPTLTDDANAPRETGAATEPQPDTTTNDLPPTDVPAQEASLDAVDAPIIAENAPAKTATEETSIDPLADAAQDDNRLDPEMVASLEAALADERQRAAALEAALEDARRDAATTSEALQDARAQTEAARAAIAGLRAENDALKTAPRQSPVAAGAIALNAIIEAADSGAPYTSEMPTLKQASPDRAAISVLERYADSGAPSLSEIRESFDAAARTGLANANRENADGVVERYGARIAGLFNIRPATPQPGAAPGAIISRAEHAVDRGDLSLAVSELEALPTSAQNAMGEWMVLARERTEFDAALRSLNADLAERAARGTL